MKDIEGQISLFDIIQPAEKTIDDYIQEAVLRGTGFVGGKERVHKLYQQEMSPQERAYAIKREYGIGGAGWPLDGYGLHGYDTFHDGLRIEWRDETGDHEKVIAWKHVEEIIHKLVKCGKYEN